MTLEDLIIATLRQAKIEPRDYGRALKLMAWRNRERTRKFIHDLTVYGSATCDFTLPPAKDAKTEK